MSTIVDRYKEISKEIECTGVADADHTPIIAAILTAGEAMVEMAEALEEERDEPIEEGPELVTCVETDEEEYGDNDPVFDVPSLKGRQPVSLLQEVCQERGLLMPEYKIHRSGGEDHVPLFGGSVKVLRLTGLPVFSSLVDSKYRTKGDAKKALAMVMLIEHFDAKDTRRR